MEIIFSRYLYALGLLRSSTGYIRELRSAKKDKNKIRAGEILKILMERISNAAVRILKMKDQEKLIFVNLGECVLFLAGTEGQDRIPRIQKRLPQHYCERV
jgi:hypothetical protein